MDMYNKMSMMIQNNNDNCHEFLEYVNIHTLLIYISMGHMIIFSQSK